MREKRSKIANRTSCHRSFFSQVNREILTISVWFRRGRKMTVLSLKKLQENWLAQISCWLIQKNSKIVCLTGASSAHNLKRTHHARAIKWNKPRVSFARCQLEFKLLIVINRTLRYLNSFLDKEAHFKCRAISRAWMSHRLSPTNSLGSLCQSIQLWRCSWGAPIWISNNEQRQSKNLSRWTAMKNQRSGRLMKNHK